MLEDDLKGKAKMRVLVFAPHNDDEVLGVGGTIAKLSIQGHEIFVCEVTSWLENQDATIELKKTSYGSPQYIRRERDIFS